MLWHVLGCGTSLVVGGDTDPPADRDPRGVEQLPDAVDTSATGDTGDTGESGPAEPTPDEIFSLDRIHTFALTIGDGGISSLSSDPYTYVSADLEVDGARFENIGVRIKGRLGSLQYLPGKSALKLDFLEFGETDTLGGLEKINLNNMLQDCAKVHELASYSIHRLLGIPAPRVGYATVTINGDDYGLYSVVEDYDDEFLQDNFADPTGNLYDGDYYLADSGSYTLIDFNTSTQSLFQLDEGTDVALADIQAITNTVNDPRAVFQDDVGALVDLDEHAAFLAAAAWTGHYDSYSYYSNNYRVYFDPGRGGKAVFMPWDPDWAFYAYTDVRSTYGTLSTKCYADTSCRAAVRSYLDRLNAEVPGGEVETQVEEATALIQDALRNDPKLPHSMAEIRSCQADLVDWFGRRESELSGWAQ